MDLITQQKVERFLEFRPAVRVLHYHRLPNGEIRVLMGKHKVNGQFTIPGGRFEGKDMEGYDTIANAIWHETMFRELREEILADDWDILLPMMEDRFLELGTVLWKHPVTNQVCVDFLAAIYCPDMFEPTAATDNELENMEWVNYFEVAGSLFNNIDLAIDLLFSKVNPSIGPLPEDLVFNDEQFTLDDVRGIVKQLNEVLV